VEHVQPLERSFSWRGAAAAVGLLLVIALAAIAGMTLLHRLAATNPAAGGGHSRQSRAAATRLQPRGSVSVLVLNGNGVDGAAGALASRLLARGYRHAAASDAPGHAYARSLVLFRPGWEGAARRLAHDARVGGVAPLDGRVAPAYARDQLIVVLGG
jgi:LytR cell envelope-related transcriptional attenuator